MSIFDDDIDDVKESIRFFISLPNEEKIRIVSDLNPLIFQQSPQYSRLIPLLSKIQNDISKHNAIEIGNKLMECGLDETYARLFVTNVKNDAPTMEYQLNQISMIPDEDFGKKLSGIMKDAWVNVKANEELSEKYGIDREKIRCLVGLTSYAFNSLSLGTATSALS